MNVNEMAARILEAYEKRNHWPESNMQDHLLDMLALIGIATESLRNTKRYGLPLVFGTCAISPNDCEFWEQCRGEHEGKPEECAPGGLAFHLADIVLYTLAVMQELGLDIDAVITAEFNYQVEQAEEAEAF